MWSGRGTSDATRTLQAWYEEVIGRPYELTVAKLVGRKPAAGRAPAADAADAAPTVSTTRHVTASGPTNDSPKGFFCSELAAHAYKALGLLPPERPASGYWPVSFGQAAALQLEGGAAFGDEVPIDFHTPAVDGLRPEAAAVRARAWSEAAADFMNG